MKSRGNRVLKAAFSMIILCVIVFCVSATSKNTPTVESGAERERKVENFMQDIHKLPVDSLFRLGNRWLFAMPAKRDSALVCYLTAISKESSFRKDNDAMLAIAKSYINAAHIYSYKYSDFAEAYRLLREAERICIDYRFEKVLSHVYMNIATNISSSLSMQGPPLHGGEDKTGIRYHRLAFDSAEKSGNHAVMGYAVFNMVLSSDLNIQTMELRQYLKRYLAANIPEDTENLDYMRRFCRATLDLLEGDTIKSLEQFRILGDESIPDTPVGARFRETGRFMEAYVLEASGKPDEALDMVADIYDSALKRNDTEWMMWSAGNLHLMNERMQRKSEADKWLLQYYKARETLAKANSAKSIAELDMQREMSLYRENMVILRAREHRNSIIAWVSVIVGILVTAILVMVIVATRRRNKYIMSLYEKNIQLVHDHAPAQVSVVSDTPAVADNSRFEPDPQAMERERKEQELISKIREVLSGQEVFDPDYRLSRLCEEVGSNQTYVTKAVSTAFGKSFKAVLTDLRVAEACRRLDDPAANSLYTIEAICQEVGFKSRAAFSVAFKNVTGLSPSEYRRAARKYMQ